MKTGFKAAVFSALVGSVGMVQADLVVSLGPITPPAQTSFANPAVVVGTTASSSSSIPYNFLDQFIFSLPIGSDVASIVATINFTNGPNGPILFGISDLQVNLLKVSSPTSLVAVSWQTVTTPVAGLQQVVALTPVSPLGSGNYVLQVRGVLAAPGSYSGTLIAQPAVVPLPAALPLLMLGLGGMVVAGIRRRRKPFGSV